MSPKMSEQEKRLAISVKNQCTEKEMVDNLAIYKLPLKCASKYAGASSIELDAVGFVVQSALVRLTSSQKYIFNSVLSIFGKDIERNILFLEEKMNFQGEIERLERLFGNPKGNVSEIMRIYYTITKTGGSDTSNVIPILNIKAVHLLSPEVVDILNKCRLDAYGYLLVANNMLDLEDIKDDLLNGDVLANATPPNTIRKLKTQLGLSSATLQQLHRQSLISKSQ
uniref:Uncharacterized protein n=1 Tax=Daphnia galeata TaxID=27404 RepID=A0A8J2RQ80_9CRUS|nr:unnamed protein product [Daphnia galeata]